MKWLAVLLAGCALTSKSAPLDIRYFTVDNASTQAAPAPAHARLRLGRITPGALLRHAIIHRDSAVEVAPYETLRWTDTPDTYARRALVHALFEARAIDQSTGGDAPSLEVEVVAFEELRRGPARAGRVELRYTLADEHRVLARGTVAIERPAVTADITAVVAAIGAALDAAAADVAERVETALVR